jgi:hypothetical protein
MTTSKEKELLFKICYSKSDLKDYLFLSKNSTFSKITELLNKKYTIICDLHDKNGKFGMKIIKIENNFEDESCIITMEREYTHKLYDKFLYNLIYNQEKNIFHLEEQDEYFEKIEIKND